MSEQEVGSTKMQGNKIEGGQIDHLENDAKIEEPGLLYDVHGMLLIPQPTNRSDDPLVLGVTALC